MLGAGDGAQIHPAEAHPSGVVASEAVIQALLRDAAQKRVFDARWGRIRAATGAPTGDHVTDVVNEVRACLDLGDVDCLTTVLFAELLGRLPAMEDARSFFDAFDSGTPMSTLVAWVAASPEAQEREPWLAARLLQQVVEASPAPDVLSPESRQGLGRVRTWRKRGPS